MMPSARVSYRKAKLPTTLVAVRAHPGFELRPKPIVDQVPFHNGRAGIARGPGWKQGWPGILLHPSPSFWTDERGMAAALPMDFGRIMKKIRVFGLRPNITSTSQIGGHARPNKRERDQPENFFFANKSQFSSSFLLAQRKALSRSPSPSSLPQSL